MKITLVWKRGGGAVPLSKVASGSGQRLENFCSSGFGGNGAPNLVKTIQIVFTIRILVYALLKPSGIMTSGKEQINRASWRVVQQYARKSLKYLQQLQQQLQQQL